MTRKTMSKRDGRKHHKKRIDIEEEVECLIHY